jgi:hypothetical protein
MEHLDLFDMAVSHHEPPLVQFKLILDHPRHLQCRLHQTVITRFFLHFSTLLPNRLQLNQKLTLHSNTLFPFFNFFESNNNLKYTTLTSCPQGNRDTEAKPSKEVKVSCPYSSNFTKSSEVDATGHRVVVTRFLSIFLSTESATLVYSSIGQTLLNSFES